MKYIASSQSIENTKSRVQLTQGKSMSDIEYKTRTVQTVLEIE